MADAAHTPGPWIIDEVKTSCGRAFRVGRASNLEAVKSLTDRRSQSYACLYDDYGNGENEQKANARLIAAAPDMLAVLKELTELGIINPTGSPRLEKAKDAARTAIAKAEGRP